MLVNKVMEQMTATVVEELFNDQAVVEMLAEDPGITKKREETQQAIVYLDEAIEKINYMQASGDLERGEWVPRWLNVFYHETQKELFAREILALFLFESLFERP